MKTLKSLNQNGFTLAEILITLSIIGVIAAITIPALVQDINDAQLKTTWKKTFADLSQATIKLISENGGSLKGVFTSDESIRDKYLNHLNYTKFCSSSNASDNCWHISGKFKQLNGDPAVFGDYPGIVLSNGALIRIKDFSTSCNGSFSECGRLNIDVNGFKGPNIIGRDIFYTHILKTGLVPWGTQGDSYESDCNLSPPSGIGYGCAAKYLSQ